jgi:HK97 family phage portal protein
VGLLTLGLDDDHSWRRREVQKRSLSWADFQSLGLLNAPVAAGVAVTESTAMEWTPFLNGVVLISQDVGKIQRRALQKLEDDSREPLTGSYLDRLLRQPNPYINDLDLWATITAHALVWGDGYFEIEWDRALRPIALWPITPDKMRMEVANNRIFYTYTPTGRPLEAEDILHIKGPSYEGLKGYRTVQLARQAIGLGLALERFGASFFGNGALPGVVLEWDGEFKDTDGVTRFTKSWNDMHRGPDRSHKTAVLERGMKAHVLGTDQKNSQYTESRDAQVVEAARILNIPPHKLKHKMGERPGANLTESELDYLNGTLDPWLVKIEQECNRKLIPQPKRGVWYVEHDRNAYLRMTPTQKAENYRAYKDMGVLSAEQIAKKENLPKPEKPEPAPPPPPADPPPPPAADQDRMASVQRALVLEAVGRFVRREAEKARQACKRGAADFAAWVERFYEREEALLREYLAPRVELELARRGLHGDSLGIARGLAGRYVARSREELLDLKSSGLEDQVDRLMQRWESSRPMEMADQIAALKGEGNAA